MGPTAVKAALDSFDVKATTLWDAQAGNLKSYSSEQKVIITGEDRSGGKRTLDSMAKISLKRLDDAAPAKPASAPTPAPASKPQTDSSKH